MFGGVGFSWLASSLPVSAQWRQKLCSKQFAQPRGDSSSITAVWEREHSCCEAVKDEKAPVAASPGFLAPASELLPQSSKGEA